MSYMKSNNGDKISGFSSLTKSAAGPFWLFTLSAIVILIVSQLIQDGMFMDGMIYVSVGKNLANGIGTFWDPHFSDIAMASYHEQPPLYFGLLAVFFKVFGFSMYVERLFCLLCFILVTVYIYKLWVKLFPVKEGVNNTAWLPVLFWAITPCIFWAYINHVEETLMTVFVVASVYYIYRALFLKEKPILYMIVSGGLIFLASLTKGAQGMFPLAAVGLYWFVFRSISFKKAVGYTLVLISVPVTIYACLLGFSSSAYLSFEKYYRDRYVPTFSNIMNTTNHRFALMGELFMQLLPIIALSAVVLLFTRRYIKKENENKANYRAITWFLLIGLSGSLPLLVTLEQRGFYLVTVIPFFALAIALWVAPAISTLFDRINIKSIGFNVFKIFSMVLFVASIIFAFSQVGNSKRDGEVLADVYKINKVIKEGDVISIPPQMHDEWGTRAYFVRYGTINLDPQRNHKYFLIDTKISSTVPQGYKKLSLGLARLELYESE
jgi:4-amino-4-deoxy-L-arabinose transferase-like glycosyltransferase